MNNIMKMAAVVAAAVLVFCGCSQRMPDNYNPLSEVDPGMIQIARFMGTSSPVEGMHYETKDKSVIIELYGRFSLLR